MYKNNPQRWEDTSLTRTLFQLYLPSEGGCPHYGGSTVFWLLHPLMFLIMFSVCLLFIRQSRCTFLSLVAVYVFLSGDLSRESLSNVSEQKRTKFAKSLEELLNKIQSTHSIKKTDTPSARSETTPTTKPAPPTIPDHEPTDYLAFEPAQLEGEEPQEMYEAMQNEEEQDVYEAPGKSLQRHVYGLSLLLGEIAKELGHFPSFTISFVYLGATCKTGNYSRIATQPLVEK